MPLVCEVTPPIDFRRKRNQQLRVDVFERDDYTCQGCGWRPESLPENYDGRFTIGGVWPHRAERILHVDHVIPRIAGGPSILENLRTLCESCNVRKGANLVGAS